MKTILFPISSLILLSQFAIAGGHWPCQDEPGGCQMPQVESIKLSCAQTQIALYYNPPMNDSGTLRVRQNNSTRYAYYSYHLSQMPGRGRVISYSDSFCSRHLTELSKTDWLETSTCEGTQFSNRCSTSITTEALVRRTRGN